MEIEVDHDGEDGGGGADDLVKGDGDHRPGGGA